MSGKEDGIAYLVLEGRHLDFALAAKSVTGIVREGDWTGAPPLDVASLWGFSEPHVARDRAARLLVVDTSSGPRALRVSEVAYRSVPRASVCALPAPLSTSRAASLVDGVVFEKERRALVVINPEGLARAAG